MESASNSFVVSGDTEIKLVTEGCPIKLEDFKSSNRQMEMPDRKGKIKVEVCKDDETNNQQMKIPHEDQIEVEVCEEDQTNNQQMKILHEDQIEVEVCEEDHTYYQQMEIPHEDQSEVCEADEGMLKLEQTRVNNKLNNSLKLTTLQATWGIAPNYIVGVIMTRDQILEETLPFPVLVSQLLSNDDAIRFLAARRLIKNSSFCERCQLNRVLISTKNFQDGRMWRCRVCRRKISIRNESFFSKSRLSLEKIIYCLYGWARNMPQKDVALDAGVSVYTLVDWNNFCREVCEQWLQHHPNEIGGMMEDGTQLVVEIDKSKFMHRGYRRGQWREEHWVFGGVERGTSKCFIVEVPDRTAATLEGLIQKYILPGTHIVHDGWAAYANIGNIGGGLYTHDTLNKQHFVDPLNAEIHIENVKNMWMRFKRKLSHQYGTSDAMFNSYVHEFVWRSSIPKDNILRTFNYLVAVIGDEYNVQ